MQSARVSVSYSWRNSSRSLSFVGWGAFDESMRSVRATVATGSPGAPISAQLLVPGSGPMIVAAGGDTGGSGVTPTVVGGGWPVAGRGRRRRCCASCTPTSSPEGRRRTQTPRILEPSASRLVIMIAGSTHTPSSTDSNAGPAEAGHCTTRRAAATVTISGGPIGGSWQSRPTIRTSIGEAQKRRSGRLDLVRPTPVGSIAAHEATSHRAAASVFRSAERRESATVGSPRAFEA